jgi:hypothetical protein
MPTGVTDNWLLQLATGGCERSPDSLTLSSMGMTYPVGFRAAYPG